MLILKPGLILKLQPVSEDHIKFSRTNYQRKVISRMVHPVLANRILRPQAFAPSPSLRFSVLVNNNTWALKEHFSGIICRRSQRNMELVNNTGSMHRNTHNHWKIYDWLSFELDYFASQFLFVYCFYSV